MELGVWVILAALGSAESPPVNETACAAMVQNAQGKIDVVNDARVKVLEQTRANEFFSVSRENTRAIVCRRTDIIPLIADLKVLDAGYPLHLVHTEKGTTRIGVLEMIESRYRFRIIKGELTVDEKRRLLLRLDEMQQAARGTAGRPRR